MVEPVSMSIAIASLVSSAPHWFHAIENSALNQGKDYLIGEGKKRFQNYLDERKHTQNVQLALKNAAERGLKQFTTPEERDLYRDVLQVLSEGNSEALRREAVRQLSLSNEPDYRGLSEKYNLSQRITALAEKTTHSEVDATPYLKSFFDALLIELYNDPLFRAQMSDLIQVRAGMSGQRSLEDILATLRQLYDMLDNSYTPEQFQQEVDAYLKFIEGRFRTHKLVMGVVLSRDEERSPDLDRIFVPLRIEMDTIGTRDTKQDDKKDILALLEQYSYLVLLGGPGSGKSTTTRYLTWQHAKAHTAPEPASSQDTKVLSGQPVPLHIELRLYSENCKKHPHSFLSYITDVILKQKDISVSTQMFKTLLERRAMLVLFDGLDEVPLSERKQLVEDIEDFAQRYPGNRILVTSRPVGYDLTRFTDRLFQHGRVQDFDDEQIQQFIDNWYRHVLKYTAIQTEEQQEIDLFYNTLMRNERLHKLASNPLLLTVMTALHRYRRLPDERNALYEQCADLLLDTWAKLKYDDMRWRDIKMSKNDQMACLAHLGFVLHTRAQEREPNSSETEKRERQQDTAVDVPESFLHKEIKKFLAEQNLLSGAEQGKEAERFLEMVKVEAGLLVERGTDEAGEALYGFVHRTFQEYFASVDVYNHYEEEGNVSIIRNLLKKYAYDAHWREVVLLLLSRLKSKLVTKQLRLLLSDEDYPGYKDVTQQDLFFVALCLQEGISVENDFAEEVLSRLLVLAESSPFYAQWQVAIGVFFQLQKSRLYADIGQRNLESLIKKMIAVNVLKAIDIAQVIYHYSPDGSAEKAEGLRLLMEVFKQGKLTMGQQIQVAQVIYEYSPDGSAEQAEGARLLIEVFKQGKLSVDEQIQVARAIYEYSPDGSAEKAEGLRLLMEVFKQGKLSVDEQIQVAQVIYGYSSSGSSEQAEGLRLLIEMFKQGKLTVGEQIQVARAIYENSPDGSAEKAEGARLLIEVFKRGKLTVGEQMQVARAIYENSPDGSSEQAVGLRLLIEMFKQGGLSVDEQIQVAQVMYWYGSARSSEKAEGARLLIKVFKQGGLSADEQIQVVQAIYEYSPDGSAEQAEGLQLLMEMFKGGLSVDEQIQVAQTMHWYGPDGSSEGARLLIKMFKQGGLSVDEQIQVAQAMYRYGPDGSSEGARLLIEVFKRGGLSADEQIQIAQAIYQNSPAESAAKSEGARLLIKVFKQGRLSVDEQIQVVQAIYENSPDGSSEQAEGLRLLMEVLKQGGLTVGEQVQVARAIYENSPDGSIERTFIVQKIAQMIQEQDIPVNERMRLAILPCARDADNFLERLEAVHTILTFIPDKNAKAFIDKKWQEMPLSDEEITKEMLETYLSSSDINAIYEMAKMDGLPDSVRDEMYSLLNQIVAVRGTVDKIEDEDD